MFESWRTFSFYKYNSSAVLFNSIASVIRKINLLKKVEQIHWNTTMNNQNTTESKQLVFQRMYVESIQIVKLVLDLP